MVFPHGASFSAFYPQIPLGLWGFIQQVHQLIGGPHSVTTTAFAPSAAFFVQLGYSVHLVNYRGSLSFGQASIKALKGRCGDIDVADTVQVAEDIVSKGLADAHRLFFLGGSHSGFIGAHLAGQYPDLFEAYSLRNPVTNIAAMAAATDIGDWCLEELGLPGAHSKYKLHLRY